MQLQSWLLVFLCLIGTDAFIFSSQKDNAKEPIGTCGGHNRVRKNQPEHARSFLDNKRVWLMLALVLCVKLLIIYKRNPAVFRSLFRLPLKKSHLAAPSKDSILRALDQFEMDLVALMSTVRHLKSTMKTSGRRRAQRMNKRPRTRKSITIYDIED